MLELGRPTHTLDADLVGKLSVARVEAKVLFRGLDGVERSLEPGDLTIWSGSRPVALAGIIGSGEAEVSEETRRVLLESACFRAGRRAEVVSDGTACGMVGLCPEALSQLSRAVRYEPLPASPGSWHDFPLLWPEVRSYQDPEAMLAGFRDERVLRREMRGSYRGPGLPPGRVCHTVRYHLGSPERTLDGSDLAEVMERFGAFIADRGMMLW